MNMKIFACLFALALVVGCASSGTSVAPPNSSTTSNAASRTSNVPSGSGYYTVTNLGTFGGNDSSAASINQIGWVTGSANEGGDQYSEAALWAAGAKVALGTLGGENSGVDWPNHNNNGLIAGISETAAVDPLGEDWSCQAFFPTFPDTKHVCLGFMWRGGKMTALGTLGGINGYAAGTNDESQIVGWAETSLHDPTCTAVTQVPNSFYQVLQFEPVVWEPNGRIQQLPTIAGDPDGAAVAVNDLGQIVGISGTCDQAVGRFSAAHAVIWQNEIATVIPTFGGISWNTPEAINNRGEVAGFANLPGDTNGQFQPIGFVWSGGKSSTKILPLPGDTNAEAAGINDLGQVVGVSFNINTGAQRAFIWENGKTMDLNSFLPAGSALYLLSASDINDRGEIVGQANVIGTAQSPAFLATPARGWNPATATPLRAIVSPPLLPASVRAQFMHRTGIRTP